MMKMSKVIEVIYENRVFKPLEKVDLEGRVKIKIEKKKKEIINSCRGIFGKTDVEELRKLEEQRVQAFCPLGVVFNFENVFIE